MKLGLFAIILMAIKYSQQVLGSRLKVVLIGVRIAFG